MEWLNVLIQGSLLGGIYALFAIGLSLSFGIMRLVNIAHGDLIILSAYVALVVTQQTGLDPISSLVVVVPVMFALGYAVQRGLLNFTLAGGLLPPLLVTFGISIIIQNGSLQGFGAYTRRLQEARSRLPAFSFPAGYRSAYIRCWFLWSLRFSSPRARSSQALAISSSVCSSWPLDCFASPRHCSAKRLYLSACFTIFVLLIWPVIFIVATPGLGDIHCNPPSLVTGEQG